MPTQPLVADIAVIGGSGIYSLFEADSVELLGTFMPETPYGETSGPLSVGRFGERNVAFLARHGNSHRWAPHTLPARANIRALADLGVKQIYSSAASGSLNPGIRPGDFVVPDQLVDLTRGRKQTYFDEFSDQAVHISFAHPYCNRLRQHLITAAVASGTPTNDTGTMVVTEGPRFETRAETSWFAREGWSIVNMTGMPEPALARELGICYATLALATNFSVGVADGSSDDVEDVFAAMRLHGQKMTSVFKAAIEDIPEGDEVDCPCVG